jgi:hypothetical protein
MLLSTATAGGIALPLSKTKETPPQRAYLQTVIENLCRCGYRRKPRIGDPDFSVKSMVRGRLKGVLEALPGRAFS